MYPVQTAKVLGCCSLWLDTLKQQIEVERVVVDIVDMADTACWSLVRPRKKTEQPSFAAVEKYNDRMEDMA